ncbi:MAG: hypothetical protein CMJ39_06370 [Phycisphaerae bacterium]|nr:hypothetical protein [Phycisphaerae bacterium]
MLTRTIAMITLMLVTTSVVDAADTWDVPGDFATIQEAINAAGNYDTINVGPGVYYEAISYEGKVLQIIGTDGPESTILDGSGHTSSIVNLTWQLAATTRLQGFTLRGANGGTPVGQDPVSIIGGAICIMGGGPTIEDCIFEDNHSGYGGAIHSDGAMTTIRNCVFRDNSASANAGAVLAINGSVTIENCDFDNNHATLWGGALHIVQGSPSLTNCNITNNSSIHAGGFYWHQAAAGSSLPVTGCTITNNYAKNTGGGIQSLIGRPPIVFTDSTLCDNEPQQIVGPFIDNGGNTLCVCPADINDNQSVDINDILVIVAQWGTDGPQGDINMDGTVDIADLLEAIDAFGPCANP